MDQSPEFLTLREVAARLRVNVATARRWAAEGNLPAVKIGGTYRVRAADLDKQLAPEATA